MPPKAKFTREEIIEAALKLTSENGIEAITARKLGSVLGTSSRPIFTAFRNMEELLEEVKKAAEKLFNEYAKKAYSITPAFKQIGLQMIMFAYEQPKLFTLLFMSEKPNTQNFENLFENLGELAPTCIEVIMRDYNLDNEKAMLLFKQLWIYTYGVGVLVATGMCRFDMNEVQTMLTQEFQAMLKLIV